jgi:hypothetical protein
MCDQSSERKHQDVRFQVSLSEANQPKHFYSGETACQSYIQGSATPEKDEKVPKFSQRHHSRYEIGVQAGQ